MKAAVNREKVLFILDWCIRRFGKSKFNDKYPKLRVYKTEGKSGGADKKSGLAGSYLNGTISIYLGSISSMKMLCKVMIHEYKHYLLDENEFHDIYSKMRKDGHTVKYVTYYHPHEKKANIFEKKWENVCYKILKHRLYKK